MRRTELIEGVKTVLSALERSGLQKALGAIFEGGPGGKEEGISTELLTTLNAYAIDASKFGETEQKIVSVLQIDSLADPRQWTNFAERSAVSHQIWLKVSNAERFLPEFMRLIEQDYVETMKHDPSKAPAAFQGKGLLSVILLEEKGKYSNPKRVIETLEAVQLFYESAAILNEERNEQQMVLLACDSGSDKSFDLLGVAKLVEAVKEIILSLWDRVVFFREQKIGAKIELVAHSLPILEKISEMQKAGHLEPEQAEILRRNISLGAEKFINAGAIIPEIENHSHHNPRQLMAPAPKLLAMPPPEVVPTKDLCPPPSSAKPSATDDLSSEERAEFERFYKQMKRKKSKKPSHMSGGETESS
jgi:hypothetical protein